MACSNSASAKISSARNSKPRLFCPDWEDLNVTERKFENLQLIRNKFLKGNPQKNISYFSYLRFRNWEIKDNLRNSFDTVHQWFYENYMVLNARKCHFMCLGNNTENETFLFHNILMENSKEQKILGVITDNKLNFKSYVSELCKKASQKIAPLSRLSSYQHNSEKKLIFNSIIKSQFSYCPLAWMFCSRTSNNMINKLHERSLRITLNDYSSD